MGTKKHQRRYSKKKAGVLTGDLLETVIPAGLGALIGWAAAKTGRGAMIGLLAGAAAPMLYRGFGATNPQRRMFLLIGGAGLSAGTFYLSYSTEACAITRLPDGAIQNTPQELAP
jgi:hypothetical protein